MTELVLTNVSTHYGSSQVLLGVSLELYAGEVVCLLGRNGAGKTTTIKTIMGLPPASAGSITFNGKSLIGLPPFSIARMGIGYVPDDRLIFPDLTVRENLELAARKPSAPGAPEWTCDRVYELFPVLAGIDSNLGGYLSGGEQQMLAIGRTLMGNPSLLLLDEPVEGVAPIVVFELCQRLRELKESGLTILLSEQNLRFATEISDRAYVIEKGRIRYHGRIDELEQDTEIQQKYLMI